MDHSSLLFVLLFSLVVGTKTFSTSRSGNDISDSERTKKLINLLKELRDYAEDEEEDDWHIDGDTSLDDVLFRDEVRDAFNEDQASEILFDGDEYIKGYDALTNFINLEEEWFQEHDTHLGSGYRHSFGTKRNFDTSGGVQLWPNAKVPYTARNFNEQRSKDAIKKAVEIIGKETCVELTERGSTGAVDYLTFDGKESGCASYVGKTGNQQIVAIEEPGCATPDTIIHEVMHALGQQHEQSRSDRAKYITILWKNIAKDNYVNYGKELTDDRVSPYDYFSTLQYSLGNEMKIADARLEFLTSAAKTLSHYDVKEIVKAYKCDGTCGTTTCDNGGFARKTVKASKECSCRCPDGLKGTSCNEREGDADCGEIISLANGQSKTFKAPGYDSGTYSTGKECIWFVKGTGTNARIKVELEELDIVASETTCPHFLSMRYSLVGQPGVNLCNKITSPKTYLKTVSDETNMFLLKFSSSKTAASNTGKKGFKLKVSAYQSGCTLNACKNYIACTDLDNADYKCTCQSGFSGKNCDKVTADAVVTCNFETDIGGKCCMKNDKSITNARWFEQGKGAVGEEQVYAKEGSVFARVIGRTYGSVAILQTKLSFDTGARCLQFTAIVEKAREGIQQSILDVYTLSGSVENKLTSLVETKSNNWQEFKIPISNLQGKQVVFAGTIGDTMLAIDNIIISKTCTGEGASVCANKPCQNGGVCTGSGASFKCQCKSGFGGSICQTVVKPCDAKPCQNNGQCLNKATESSAYTCVCVDGYKGTNCETIDTSCKSGQWKCADGQCIAEEFRCDWRVTHCNDKSDEKGCTDHCLSKPCQNGGQCQSEKFTFTCKCANGFTGKTCAETVTCTSSQFKCSNGEKCIPADYRCDQIEDCTDKSDEYNCGTACNAAIHFKCKNGQCINEAFRCDDVVDCVDNSDEEGCPQRRSNTGKTKPSKYLERTLKENGMSVKSTLGDLLTELRNLKLSESPVREGKTRKKRGIRTVA
ncbi:fibropellin-1-like [Ylistrum balloti]|uniref:fibropellin-1-like n=1 Tax=Ylistrum balloti TaxID=509963 RepID=UPI0029059D93|nr:fibropellin-1-like [Ylistrum balloti]